MDDVIAEESTDQTETEEVEESQDQPDAEETSDESEISDDEEQPDEDSSEEFIEIDGEEVSLEELKKGYLRQSDYTRKTQEVADQRKQLEDFKNLYNDTQQKKEMSPEEKQVFDFIEKYGLVTKDSLEKKMSITQAKALDQQEFNSWKAGSGADSKIASAVYELGKAFPKKGYAEIYSEYFTGAKPKKVVSRKVVGVKGKGTTTKSQSGYTRERIAELAKSGEYAKHRDRIMAAMKRGEIN